jgi:hypothetical protein
MSLNDSGLIDRWEYRVEHLERGQYESHTSTMTTRLNALGNEGWELVTTTVLERKQAALVLVCVFKRPRLQSAVEETPPPPLEPPRPHRFSSF